MAVPVCLAIDQLTKVRLSLYCAANLLANHLHSANFSSVYLSRHAKQIKATLNELKFQAKNERKQWIHAIRSR